MKKLSVLRLILIVATFGFFALISSCKKESAPTPANTTEPTYFLKGTLGAETISTQGDNIPYTNLTYSDLHNGSFEDNHGDGDDDDDRVYATGSRWTNVSNSMQLVTGSVELRKLIVRVYVAPISSSQLYYNLLKTGTYTFANNDASSGVYISLRDKNGVLWTSQGDQSGSTLQITSRGENTGAYTTVSGVMNAKMYDGNGNMKLLTNASFNMMAGLQ